jgi:hypothetical protein
MSGYAQTGHMRSNHVLCSPNFLCSLKFRHRCGLTEDCGTVLASDGIFDRGRR